MGIIKLVFITILGLVSFFVIKSVYFAKKTVSTVSDVIDTTSKAINIGKTVKDFVKKDKDSDSDKD